MRETDSRKIKVGRAATPTRQSNMRVPAQLEITLSITAYIAAIVGVGLGARLILEAVGPHPGVAQAVYWTIVPAAGLGGLVAFWFVCSRVEFLWRGYQVSFREGRAYYEERDASGERRGLAFDWFPLTEGYRPRGFVRLPPGTWEVDAPVWARRRRDDIAGRITKDLTSSQGWPALLLPDAPAVDSPADTNATSTLIGVIVDRWPEWAPYVVPRAEGGRADRVLLSLAPPQRPSHRLEVACSEDALQITYDCGYPGLRAAATFSLTDRAAALACVCEFLRELRDGEMVVLIRRVPLLTRWRRSDSPRRSAQFLSVSRPARDSHWCAYQWLAERH